LTRGATVASLAVLAGAGTALIPRLAFALGNDTVFLSANAGVAYDSNVFRIAEGVNPPGRDSSNKSDVIYGIGAGVRFDLPVSRQRFRGDASATKYMYSRFDELDYTGYTLGGIWDWRAGSKWHGSARAGLTQTRQKYSEQVGFFIPSLLKSFDAGLDARYVLTPSWELQAGASTSRTRFSEQFLQIDDFDLTSLSVGASYRTKAGNSTGGRLLYEQGEWPNRPPAPIVPFGNEYSQYTLSAVMDWQLTGKSQLSGDIGYTAQDRQEGAVGESVNGLSGHLTYNYSLTGKSTVAASLYQTRGPYEDLTATYIKTTGIDLAYINQLTAKTVARANATFSKLDYLGESVLPGTTERKDELASLGVSVTYQATRTMSLSSGVRYDQRRSNVQFGDYNVYYVYLNGRIEF
jgi:exopolysaccharide biosynthesis operon protein EpsL